MDLYPEAKHVSLFLKYEHKYAMWVQVPLFVYPITYTTLSYNMVIGRHSQACGVYDTSMEWGIPQAHHKNHEQRKSFSCTVELKTVVNCSK